MGQLDGKVAVIVGASGEKNFGSSIARRFAATGAKVVVSGRRLEALESLASDIAAAEYAGKNIRFNSIAAGLIETDMTAGLFAMEGE